MIPFTHIDRPILTVSLLQHGSVCLSETNLIFRILEKQDKQTCWRNMLPAAMSRRRAQGKVKAAKSF